MLPVSGPNTGNPDQELKARIVGWIRDELANAARGGIGLHVDGATGNLIIDEGEVQSGNYTPGTAGWALKPTGDAEFHGNLTIGGAATITGTLSLPAGIIGNAALANPVTGSAASAAGTSTLTTTDAVLQSTSVTVPAGFTTALVQGVASISQTAGSAGVYNLVRCEIVGGSSGTGTGTGYDGAATHSAAATLTGLTPGGTVTVNARGTTNTATRSTNASVSALVTFLR